MNITKEGEIQKQEKFTVEGAKSKLNSWTSGNSEESAGYLKLGVHEEKMKLRFKKKL